MECRNQTGGLNSNGTGFSVMATLACALFAAEQASGETTLYRLTAVLILSLYMITTLNLTDALSLTRLCALSGKGRGLLLPIFLTSCIMGDLDECPVEGQTPPVPTPSTTVEVEMSLRLDVNMNWDSEPPLESFEALKGRFDVRYIVELYDADMIGGVLTPGSMLKRYIATESNYNNKYIYLMVDDTLTLPKKKIIAAAWADFVERGQTSDKYYDTADLRHVTVASNYPHNGYKAEKDAFSGNETVDLANLGDSDHQSVMLTVALKRPFAAYEIIATDYEEYTKRKKDIAPQLTNPALLSKAQYMLYFPTGFRPPSGKPDDYKAGIGYSMYAVSFDDEADGDLEALLATDCIFVEGTTAYDLDLTLYDESNKPLGMVEDKRVHLQQNQVTRIRDSYLTNLSNGGGAGIDDSFDNEEVITIKK